MWKQIKEMQYGREMEEKTIMEEKNFQEQFSKFFQSKRHSHRL